MWNDAMIHMHEELGKLHDCIVCRSGSGKADGERRT